MKKEAEERAKLFRKHGTLQFLSGDRRKYSFAKAKHGMIRIGRPEGLPDYVRSESSVRRLGEEYFNDPAAGSLRVKSGQLDGR